jgi:hypothetical protein
LGFAKRKTKDLCIFNPACWQEAIVAGMCGACYSWWRNFQLKSAPEVTLYLKRVNRYHGRIMGKGRPISNVKAKLKLIKG